MNANDYWNLFLETGAPECYLMFRRASQTEEQDVLENSGPCAPPDGVQ